MKRPTKSKRRVGRPETEPLRWNLQQAEREFGPKRDTLSIRARALGIMPGDDGCYTSRNILAMIAGDKETETIGKIKAEREFYELRNEETRRQRIPIELIAPVYETMFRNVRGIIMASRLSDNDKQDIFAELREGGQKMKELAKP